MEQINLTEKEIADAFAEWCRQFRADPGSFGRQTEYLTPEQYGAATALQFMEIVQGQRLQAEVAAGERGSAHV